MVDLILRERSSITFSVENSFHELESSCEVFFFPPGSRRRQTAVENLFLPDIGHLGEMLFMVFNVTSEFRQAFFPSDSDNVFRFLFLLPPLFFLLSSCSRSRWVIPNHDVQPLLMFLCAFYTGKKTSASLARIFYVL